MLGIFIGLVLGVLIACGFVWYLNKTPLPFQTKAPAPLTEQHANASVAASSSSSEPAPLGGKPGDQAIEKSRFDFYNILPNGTEPTETVSAPASDLSPVPTPKESTHSTEPPVNIERLYLQAGAFPNPEDADNLKAKLAFLGVETSIYQVIMTDGSTWYRVRLGPYRGSEDIRKAKTQLQQAGIQSTIVKLKESVDR